MPARVPVGISGDTTPGGPIQPIALFLTAC